MFKFISGLLKKEVPGVTAPPAYGDPKYAELLRFITRGEFKSAEGLFSGLDVERQAKLLRGFLEASSLTHESLDRWIKLTPDSTLCLLCLAIMKLDQAQQARSSARASEVTDEQFERFQALSGEAGELLAKIFENNPDHLHARNWYTQCGFARIYDKADVIDNYLKLKSIAPDFFGGTTTFLYYLTPKWFGSSEELIDLVEDEASQHEEGSVFHGLLPAALFHIWEYEDRFQDNHCDIFNEYSEEIISSFKLSLGSPKYKKHPYEYYLLNFYAYAFWEIDLDTDARRLMDGIGKNFTHHPWYVYEGDARSCYNHARLSMGLKVLKSE